MFVLISCDCSEIYIQRFKGKWRGQSERSAPSQTWVSQQDVTENVACLSCESVQCLHSFTLCSMAVMTTPHRHFLCTRQSFVLISSITFSYRGKGLFFKVLLLSFTVRVEVLPKPWNKAFVHARKRMRDKLHSINPTMQQVLYFWHVCYKWVCYDTFFTFVKTPSCVHLFFTFTYFNNFFSEKF